VSQEAHGAHKKDNLEQEGRLLSSRPPAILIEVGWYEHRNEPFLNLNHSVNGFNRLAFCQKRSKFLPGLACIASEQKFTPQLEFSS